jgi:hypothetical protein
LGKSKLSCLKAWGLTGFPKSCHVSGSDSYIWKKKHKKEMARKGQNCWEHKCGWSWGPGVSECAYTHQHTYRRIQGKSAHYSLLTRMLVLLLILLWWYLVQ